MYRIVFLLFVSLFLTSCFSFEVEPKEIISGTVTATKRVYSSINRSKTGRVEREFTHSLPYENKEEIDQLSKECLDHVRSMISHTFEQDFAIVSESTGIKPNKILSCNILAEGSVQKSDDSQETATSTENTQQAGQ